MSLVKTLIRKKVSNINIVNDIENSLSNIKIEDNDAIKVVKPSKTQILNDYKKYEKQITIIQKIFKGNCIRKKRLPNVLYYIQNYLSLQKLVLNIKSNDGRINSCLDEDQIIDLLVLSKKFKIFRPEIRMWYDILVYDYIYGCIPINIKTTTTQTADNTGNLAMCVYAYTNEKLDLKKSYNNGNMAKILTTKLVNKNYNTNYKKDYFFVVVNKEDTKKIIINSVKGLESLTSNINNLPFQVKWCNNTKYKYKNIKKVINSFLDSQQGPKPSWKELYLQKIRTIKV